MAFTVTSSDDTDVIVRLPEPVSGAGTFLSVANATCEIVFVSLLSVICFFLCVYVCLSDAFYAYRFFFIRKRFMSDGSVYQFDQYFGRKLRGFTYNIYVFHPQQ